MTRRHLAFPLPSNPASLACAVVALAICGGCEPPVLQVVSDDPLERADVCTPVEPDVELLRSLARSSNTFGLDLWRAAVPQDGNAALSPASIHVALTQAWAGADGETAQQMERALFLDGDRDAVHDAISAQLAAWNDPCEEQHRLAVVNGLFVDEQFDVEQDYLGLATEVFASTVDPVDFRNAPEEAGEHINGWFADQTAGRIRKVVAPELVSPDARMVLANAVYFKGSWVEPFRSIHEWPFTLAGGESVPSEMMHLSDLFAYLETDDMQLLELPYEGGVLAMVVLLPREPDGLSRLEGDLEIDVLDRWLAEARLQDVRVAFPRFKLSADRPLQLNDALSRLGVTEAQRRFHADFTGIADPADPTERLFLGEVVHMAEVEVDEKGTVATAATALTLPASGSSKPPEPPIFRADHPFLFLIRDTSSGSILFMGRMSEPTEGR